MIDASGGGRDVKTEDDAVRANAMVKIRPILSRSDLVGAIMLPETIYEKQSNGIGTD